MESSNHLRAELTCIFAHVLPQFRQDVKSGKKMLSKEIRGGTVKGERRIYVFLPDPSQHTNHAVGEVRN